jgi:hypothetical protein
VALQGSQVHLEAGGALNLTVEGFAACIGKLGVVHFFVFVSKVGK